MQAPEDAALEAFLANPPNLSEVLRVGLHACVILTFLTKLEQDPMLYQVTFARQRMAPRRTIARCVARFFPPF
jgi:hypothetical protein